MKLDFKHKEDSIEEVSKKNQEQKKELVLINSIEPKPNHLLFTFKLSDCGTFFHGYQQEWKIEKEIVFINKNGKFIEKKTENKSFIDIFNPNFKADKKRYDMVLENGICYITALNYKNACKKFKELNPQYFR